MDDVTKSMLSEKQLNYLKNSDIGIPNTGAIVNSDEWKYMNSGAMAYKSGNDIRSNPYIHFIDGFEKAYYWHFGFCFAKSVIENADPTTLSEKQINDIENKDKKYTLSYKIVDKWIPEFSKMTHDEKVEISNILSTLVESSEEEE